MTDHGNTVLREALALPADERAQVAADLLASLDEERDETEEVTSSWAAEIERRARQGWMTSLRARTGTRLEIASQGSCAAGDVACDASR